MRDFLSLLPELRNFIFLEKRKIENIQYTSKEMYLMKTSRIVAVLCIFCCFFGQESHAFYLIEGGELDPHQLSQIEEQLQQMDQVTKQKQDGSYKPNWVII